MTEFALIISFRVRWDETDTYYVLLCVINCDCNVTIGRPSDLYQETSPDWTPSVNYYVPETPNVDRYSRVQARRRIHAMSCLLKMTKMMKMMKKFRNQTMKV